MSTSATRCLSVLHVLRGHTLKGLSNSDIAKALGETAVNITRATATLIESGFVTKLENGHYALGTSLLQIATAHSIEMQQAQDRINEINQRVMAGANQLIGSR